MISIKDKIKGMFLGIQIGDSLGMPVETYTADKIKAKYDFLTDYVAPKDHKWFDPELHPAGSYTDDTQLTLAVARAIIAGNGIVVDNLINSHIEAFDKYTGGWGSSTRTAIQYMKDNMGNEGFDWVDAAMSGDDAKSRGFGNGVSMKVAPLAAYMHMKRFDLQQFAHGVERLDAMTHNTQESLLMAIAHAYGVKYCLSKQPSDFDPCDMAAGMLGAVVPILPFFKYLNTEVSDALISIQFFLHGKNRCSTDSVQGVKKERFAAIKSVPLVYLCFSQDPMNIGSLYTAVNSGGDTDTNASMVGALLGALHGPGIFPDHLKNGLDKTQRQEVAEVAEAFCQLGGCTPELVGHKV